MNIIETRFYRKKSNTDIYIICYLHSPSKWKIVTLQNLIARAKNISSTEDLLNQEIKHFKNVFCNIEKTTEKIRKQLKKVLPDNVKTMVTYQSKNKKLASKFPVKNKISF